MSVFGGDSWARDAQQRKRRLDDLMLPAASSSSSLPASGSFKRLSNGKLACLVCPHRPVLDSPVMLSVHNKGSRHIAAESRLRESELSRHQEINKRLALSSEASFSNSGKPHPGPGGKTSGMKEKPLVEETRRAILDAQSSRFIDFSGKEAHGSKWMENALSCGSQVSPSVVPMKKWTRNTCLIDSGYCKELPFTGDQTPREVLPDWQADVQKRQQQELRFTAAGWKRDSHGRWYRDENVEFDSDEDDPNICLA